ncbi:4'-phosphopantetheinyl transferase family protein [Streptomyces sp. CB02460]|uniref:4'-phosphopantetheinyl transferase family protein n=1 Tax=Streptomyces sp. CB02460 TaxID=1703941 RepID=UPI00095C1A68|nr:4'-phosphopantetheinyl transferase superfamily protein [Streptomyces sp. CB02460]OKJ70010.1 4'-phosphopantetheinyl transferase [Streptomyces sp. CB02460]
MTPARHGPLAGLLPPGAELAEAFEDPPDAELFPEERALADLAASEERRREFATVRTCARTALARLRVPPAPVLPRGGPDPWARHAPVWPEGVVGSMTHCPGYRAAAVARAHHLASLGVDAEAHAPLPAGVVEALTLPEERRHLARLARAHPLVAWDSVLFSAKESVYKAWFPLTGRWLGFLDCAVLPDRAGAPDPTRGTFTAVLRVPGPEVAGVRLERFTGRWRVLDGPGGALVGTAVAVPAHV